MDVGIVNGSNRGRGGCSCDGRVESVAVGCALGGLVVTGQSLGGVLQVSCACHGHVVDVFDVARVDGIDAIPDGSMDGFVVAFGGSGGSKDKHIKVEEDPPEGGGVDGECICIGDGLDGVGS